MAEVGIGFILEITLIMVVVGLSALVLPRLKYPPAIGYLLGGLILGALILPLITFDEPESISFFADLGIILLMFYLGLEFNLKRLRKIGLFGAVAGTIEIAIMMAIGYSLGGLLGWGAVDSFLLGAVMAISSTALITKTLMDQGTLGSHHGSAAVGILIVQDFFVILVLAMISPITSVSSMDVFPIIEILLRLALFIVVSLVLGLLLVPKAIDTICSEFKEETVLLVSLSLCFVMVMISLAAELSVAIGAFIMGIIISRARSSEVVASKVRPVSLLFVAIFFVSMGMLIDPSTLVGSVPTALIISAVFILGCLIAVTFAAYVANQSARNSLMTGLTMVTMGEFSIIIAKVGLDSEIIGPEFYSAILTSTLITMLLYPFIQRHAASLVGWTAGILPASFKSSLARIEEMRMALRKRIKASTKRTDKIREEISWIFIDIIIILIIVIGANIIYGLRELPVFAGMEQGLLAVVILVVTLILLAPPIISIVNRLKRIVDLFTTWTVESGRYREGDRRFIHRVFARIISAMVGLMIVFFILPFISTAEGVPWFMLALLIILSAATVYLLWSTFHSVHARVSSAIKRGMEDEEKPP